MSDSKSDLPFNSLEAPDYKVLNDMYVRILNLERENRILAKSRDELYDDVRRAQLDIALLFCILGALGILGLLLVF